MSASHLITGSDYGNFQSLLWSVTPVHNSSSESPEIHTLYRVSGSLALLSFIGALFVIITFITIKDLRKHPTRMIFFLSVCDVMFSLKYLVTSVLPHSDQYQGIKPGCYIQAGFQQFFGLASIGWSGMISLNLIISTSRPFENTSSYSKIYHIWIWGFSLITSILMFANGEKVIGASGDGTCWIKSDNKPFLLLFFIPLLSYILISISSLVVAAISTKNALRNSSTTSRSWTDRNRTNMLLRMSTYTLVFILCWAGPLAHRISQFAGHKDLPNHTNVLMFFDAIGVSIQGFMNAIIWLTNPSILRGFLDNAKKYLPFAQKYIGQTEKTPLIQSLQDDSQDPAQLASILRTNILTCSLRGISLSVNDNIAHSTTDPIYSSSIGPIIQHLPHNNSNNNSNNNYNIEPLSSNGNGSRGKISLTSSNTSVNSNNNNNNNGSGNYNNNNNHNNGGSGSISTTYYHHQHSETFSTNKDYKVYTERELFSDAFENGNAHIGHHKFKDYCPIVFAKIRALNNITPSDYLKSFDSTSFFENLGNQKFSEGKSGSFMCFTPDNKFLIKTITRQESILLKKKIYNFYDHFSKNKNSFLLRFYGCHKISMPNDHTIYLAVMSNVFSSVPSGIKMKERYDIKGSRINRGGHDPNFKGVGLGLDLDFVNYRKSLSLNKSIKSEAIVKQLERDVTFLQNLNIMDYSLLIGVIPNDENFKEKREDLELFNNINSLNIENNNNNNNNIDGNSNIIDYSKGIESEDSKEIYFIGVIDMLQLYNFNKKLEHFLKVYITRKDGKGISSVKPGFYKVRFMERMNEIFKVKK